ncbi:MAG: peptidoglycan editing factor PgeF [Phycisphaerae bacterium]
MPHPPELQNPRGGFALADLPLEWTVGRFDAFSQIPGVAHMVTTKYALDVDLIRHDRATAAQLVGLAMGNCKAAWVNQVHGQDVLAVDQPGLAGQADALITNTPGLAIFCISADCPLILLADRQGRAVGAAHASWRGTVRQVTARTVRAMCDAFALRPGELVAAICPSAGPCCYEVGPDVRDAALAWLEDPERFFTPHPETPEKWLLDLWAANRAQLVAEGLAEENIHISGVCTLCRNDWFPSHRKEADAAGRFLAAIGRIGPMDSCQTA